MSEPAATTPERERTPERPGAGSELLRQIVTGNVLISVLAIVLALVIGAVLIAVADERVGETISYVFARPGDFLGAAWSAVSDAYVAMFRGAVFDWQAPSFDRQIRPLTESLVNASPLILAGLGIAIGFRAGLFNIGAQGQIIVGAILASYVGFAWDLPVVLHLLVAVVGGLVGGAIWGGIPGVLKARFGANEVIVTIMLNYVAVNLVAYLLTVGQFNASGTGLRSPTIASTAAYPHLIPDAILENSFRLHWGFVVAILAAVFTWWLLERSTLGFEIRASGANPRAARTAGMSVGRITVLTLVIAGMMAGLAGTTQALAPGGSLTAGVAASFGFDAITVALLGQSRPLGTFLAGLLFGALRAGGTLMQSVTATPIDIVLVVQSVIVLLIAAPPLVRSIFRLPDPAALRPRRTTTKEAAA